jgi:hypothetical protein
MKRYFALITLLTIAGCSRSPKYATIDEFPAERVSGLKGKTRVEVQSILGEPTREVPFEKASSIWEYEGTKQFLAAVFGHVDDAPDTVISVAHGRTREEAYQPYAQQRTVEKQLISEEIRGELGK